ncbi:hypothetical protein ACO0LL_09600 [Undibacterium sp. TC4M20W]
MTIGGAALLKKYAERWCVEDRTATTSAVSTMSIKPVLIKGCTSGDCGLSNDCLLNGSCAWVWQSAACSLSMPAQSGMDKEPVINDVTSELLPVPSFIPGQAYAATANCMNSRLHSMANTASIREVWEILIKRAIAFLFTDFLQLIDYSRDSGFEITSKTKNFCIASNAV